MEKHFDYSLAKKIDFYLKYLLVPILDKTKDSEIFTNIIALKNYINEDLSQIKFDKGDIIRDFSIPYKDLKKVTSDLGDLMGTWKIDWAWLMHHIRLDYENIGKALSLRNIEKSKGRKFNDSEILIYKHVHNESYIECKKLYLKDLETEEPKVFTLKELFKNGTMLYYGDKKLLPTLGIINFGLWNNDVMIWDDSEIEYIPDGYEWSQERKMFVPPKEYKRKIERKSKVIVTIGNKKYEC